MTTELKSATRDGVTLRYLDTGSGDPPIVFIHGWTHATWGWRDQIPHFAEKHRVVALDLRGHGESDKPDEDYSIEAFADDVAWLINELGLDKPVVIGHSMGGVIALNLAHRYAGLPRAVILIDSALALPETMSGVRDQILAGLQSPAYLAVRDQVCKQFLFNADSPPQLVEEFISRGTEMPQRVIATALATALDPANDIAGPIPVPALFIRASTHLASEDTLRERFPGMGLITVPAAHFIQMEQPAATNNIIRDFLDKLE